jgi:hypothetical protein
MRSPARRQRGYTQNVLTGVFLLWAGTLLLLAALDVLPMDPPPPAPLAWLVFLPLSLAILRAGVLVLRHGR